MNQTPRVDRERLLAKIDAACRLDANQTCLALYTGDRMGLWPLGRAYYQASTGRLMLHLERDSFPLEGATLIEFSEAPDHVVQCLVEDRIEWLSITPLAPLVALAQAAE